MTLHRWTPRDLAVELGRGRILELVPRSEVELRPVAQTMVEITWPKGPRGHAIVGLCPQTCHFVVEYPRQWRTRGREIAAHIPYPPPYDVALRMLAEGP
jgi:hypothetical protein